MSKKSSKTSHVLNLLTNRTGAVIDGEADKDKDQASPASGGNSASGSGNNGTSSSGGGNDGTSSSSSSNPAPGNGLPNPVLVEIAAPVRIAVSNPVIAELTGENALQRASSPDSEESAQKKAEGRPERKNQSVADLIQMELERTYQRDQTPPTLIPQPVQQAPSEAPQEEAPQAETRQAEAPQAEAPQAETRQAEAPQAEAPQEEAPQAEARQEETRQAEAPQEEPQQEFPSKEDLQPPHIEEFTLDEFAESEEANQAIAAADEEKAEAKNVEEEHAAAENTKAGHATGNAAAGHAAGNATAGHAAGNATAGHAEAEKAEEAAFQPCYINVMDEIVRTNVQPIMESLNMCTCSRCVNDVVALALNLLPPKYVVTEKGSLYAKVSLYEGQHKVDVLSSITKACLEVQNNPRHHLSH